MAKEQYGIIEAKKPEFPPINLLRVPHRKGVLTVAYPAFDANYFGNNVREMQKDYSHPQTGRKISFREPTTSESISAAAYNFENMAKSQIFDSMKLQAGRIVKTSEGVFVNPPRDKEGGIIIDEKILKSYLNKSIEVNGICLYSGEDARDFGFAPYETFTKGAQDCDTFAQGGLARVLEHTREKVAKNLKETSSSKNYPQGVNVWGFNDVEEPSLNIMALYSSKPVIGNSLIVSGDYWYNSGSGYAFGVLDEDEERIESTLSRRLILEKSH